MPYIRVDRVMETSTTTGVGALTLAGAVAGFRTFASVCAVSDTLHYVIEGVDSGGVPTGEWETGLGTYSGVNTLTRTTVIASSNGGAAVNFSAGTKRVFISHIAAAVVSKLGDTMTGALTIQAAGGNSELNVAGEGVTRLQFSRYSADVNSPNIYVNKYRGTIASPADIVQNDRILENFARGQASGALQTGYRLLVDVVAATPSSTDFESRERGFLCAAGSAAPTEIYGWRHSNGLSMFGSVVIDQNRIHRLRQYTVATLPTVGTAGRLAAVTDASAPTYNATVAGGGAVNIPVYDNGTNWTCH